VSNSPAHFKTQDRASVVATAAIQIIETSPDGATAHAALSAYLRDEFADIERKTATETRLQED
jgi:hypothetical protein